MNKNKPKAKAKEQKAVSRAVKQAGFKNIKEAKQALNRANKKIKTICQTTSCWEDDSCKTKDSSWTEQSCCKPKKACATPVGIWKDLNDIISCQYKFDPDENCDILTIKIKY